MTINIVIFKFYIRSSEKETPNLWQADDERRCQNSTYCCCKANHTTQQIITLAYPVITISSQAGGGIWTYEHFILTSSPFLRIIEIES